MLRTSEIARATTETGEQSALFRAPKKQIPRFAARFFSRNMSGRAGKLKSASGFGR
jgi:hypothetical protein